MTERWTPETEVLTRRALSGSATNRGYRLHDEREHLARAVLAALADAGLLVPASPTPRVWIKTENPLDVQAVVDPYGETWKREPELPGLPPSPRDTWVNAVGNRFHWYGLVGIRGPLTEVDA